MTYLKLVNTGISITNLTKNLIPQHHKSNILEPLSVIIRLAINSLKPIGTKICVSDNRIILHEPSFIQGPIRTLNGDNKDDLHFLLAPIKTACDHYLKNNNEKLLDIFISAKSGLINLKSTYHNYPIINRCLELYIKIIDNYISTDISDTKDSIDDNLDIKNIDDSRILEEIDIMNNIYMKFSKLWTENRINIIFYYFKELEKAKKKMRNYEIEKLMASLDVFLQIIEKESNEIISNIN